MHDEQYWGLEVETNNIYNKMRITFKGQINVLIRTSMTTKYPSANMTPTLKLTNQS